MGRRHRRQAGVGSSDGTKEEEEEVQEEQVCWDSSLRRLLDWLRAVPGTREPSGHPMSPTPDCVLYALTPMGLLWLSGGSFL